MALRNLTLDQFLLLTGCVILLVFFLPTATILLWWHPNEQETSLIEKSRFAAAGLAESVTDPLLTGDSYAVGRILWETLEAGEPLRYALLLDRHGKVVAHTFGEGVPEKLCTLLESNQEGVTRYQSSDGPVLDVTSPIMGGQLGSVHLGVSREEVIQSQKQIIWTALIILALALAILLIGVRWVTLLVSRPLSRLEEAARGYLPGGKSESGLPETDGTVEVRNIAARFLGLLRRLDDMEELLPSSQKKVFRNRRNRAITEVFSPSRQASHGGREDIWSETYLEDRYSWLVFHRWIAIGGIITAYLIYLSTNAGTTSMVPTFCIVLAMIGWNAVLQFRQRWPDLFARRPLRFWLMAQIVSDLFALTFLLHLFGGMENPFKLFYVFLMVIAGLTFPFRISGWIAVTGSVLYGVLILGEMASYLPHYPLLYSASSDVAGVWKIPFLVLSESVGMAIVQVGVVFFVHAVSVRRQEAEAAREAAEKIALSRERMAMLGELAAGVAHEVRNPIHGLMNCCDILREKTEGSSEEGKLITLLDEGLNRVSTISDRLLRLGHAGPVRKDPVDLGSVVSGTVELVRETARKKNVKVEIRGSRDVPHIVGDSDRLSEVVLNLLTNSLDACGEGDRIMVRLEIGGSPGKEIRLVVSDSGVGIGHDILPRIFDPFFTTKAVGQGSGLGLSLVQETVRRHEGVIEIESNVRKGTTVTIIFPLEDRD